MVILRYAQMQPTRLSRWNQSAWFKLVSRWSCREFHSWTNIMYQRTSPILTSQDHCLDKVQFCCFISLSTNSFKLVIFLPVLVIGSQLVGDDVAGGKSAEPLETTALDHEVLSIHQIWKIICDLAEQCLQLSAANMTKHRRADTASGFSGSFTETGLFNQGAIDNTSFRHRMRRMRRPLRAFSRGVIAKPWCHYESCSIMCSSNSTARRFRHRETRVKKREWIAIRK